MSDKTHGTVEDMAVRFDSYDHKLAYNQTVVNGQIVSVDRVWQNFDYKGNAEGSRVYFICPVCLRRVRYLYKRYWNSPIACRKCYKLNYRSQQTTKGLDQERMKLRKALDGMGIYQYDDDLEVDIPLLPPAGIPKKQFYTNRKRYLQARENWYSLWMGKAMALVFTNERRIL